MNEDIVIAGRPAQGRALEFGHTLEEQIGGQIAAGLAITGFYEDRYNWEDALSKYMAWFIGTRAMKQG